MAVESKKQYFGPLFDVRAASTAREADGRIKKYVPPHKRESTNNSFKVSYVPLDDELKFIPDPQPSPIQASPKPQLDQGPELKPAEIIVETNQISAEPEPQLKTRVKRRANTTAEETKEDEEQVERRSNSVFEQIMSSYPLLTPLQEITAFAYYQEELRLGQSFIQRFSDNQFFRIETGKEDKEITSQKLDNLFRDSKDVKQAIWLCNVRLVASVAKKFTGRGLDYKELVTAGYAGLNRAIEKFNLRRGLKFSTPATYWIRQSIGREIENTAATIGAPVHVYKEIGSYKRLASQFQQENKRPPNMKESKRLLTDQGITETQAQSTLDYLRMSPVSLDMPTKLDSEVTLGDITPDNKSSIDNAVDNLTNISLINNLIGCLSSKEKIAVCANYGIGMDAIKPADVTRKFGLASETLSDLRKSALLKMRLAAKANGITLESIF